VKQVTVGLSSKSCPNLTFYELFYHRHHNERKTKYLLTKKQPGVFERLIKEHYQGQPVDFEVGYDKDTFQDLALNVDVLNWRKSQGEYFGKSGEGSRHRAFPRGNRRGGHTGGHQQN